MPSDILVKYRFEFAVLGGKRPLSIAIARVRYIPQAGIKADQFVSLSQQSEIDEHLEIKRSFWHYVAMTKTGESFEREWSEDPLAIELWDALDTVEKDRKLGLHELLALSERGSALAMMYLGNAYMISKTNEEFIQAVEWLRRSAKAGSIEGRYQLACHYHRSENGEQAAEEYRILAEAGYAPAMYYLGKILYHGNLLERNVQEAVSYFERAKSAGHIPSMGYLAWIYRKEKFGLKGRLLAHWNCLAKIPAAIWHIIYYPESDRMRGFPFYR